MKTKILILLSIFTMLTSCAQTTMRSIADARKMELNKKEFVGKSLSYFLSKINYPLVSIFPYPNKNKNQINRLTLRFVTEKEFRKSSNKELNERPTQVVVIFNQNWDLVGDICNANDNPECFELTDEDKINLKDLIIYDVVVYGNN